MGDRSRVAIIGGGIAGCSLAYHLAELGWTDVTVIEKDQLTSGSTWHAAGLCTQFTPSINLTKLLMYSLALYDSLETETGQAVSLHRCGSLRLARTADRMDELQHRCAMAKILGLELEIIGPAEIAQLFPLLDADDVLGAAYLPTDGHVDPSGVTHALAAGARARGARFLRNTEVLGIGELPGDEWRVQTTAGDLDAEIVVDAAGLWARRVGQMVGVRLPIVALQHHYLVTEALPPIAERAVELPVLRDPDGSFYLRQEAQGLIVGPFEPNPLTWALDGVPPGFARQLLPPNMAQIDGVLSAAAQRVPALADAGIRRVINGPDGYTPDGRCLMGEVPGLRNFHVLAGFSIFGIVFGGGAGRYAAEWIVDGQPSDNMWELDVRRFGPYADSPRYVAARARDVYEREYAVHYPYEERPAGRPLKTSAVYDRLAERGAVYGCRSGWERPLWFRAGARRPERYTFRTPEWLPQVIDESAAVRNRVGVLDQSSFAKYEVCGPGAVALLDRLAANHLPRRVGRIALTQMCTARGGIECDCTITRLAEDRFYVVSAAATQTHDFAWIDRHAPRDGTVEIADLTARLAVLTIAGPRSRELLQRLSDDDFSPAGFPFFDAREVTVAGVAVRALRLSFVGELGWELHHPLEYQRALYESLLDAGADLGIADFGYRTLDALRLEKGYRMWGEDITPDWSPLEAGLDRFVDFDKGDFLGQDALLAQRDAGLRHTLVGLTVTDTEVLPHADEPVYLDDRIVGYTMSGGFGPTVGLGIAYAYLPVAIAAAAEPPLSIELLGRRVPAWLARQPLYDPSHSRLRT